MSSIATPPTPAPDAPSNRRGRLIVAWVLSVGLAFLLGWLTRWMFSRLNAGPRNVGRAIGFAAQLHEAEEARHRAEYRRAEAERQAAEAESELSRTRAGLSAPKQYAAQYTPPTPGADIDAF